MKRENGIDSEWSDSKISFGLEMLNDFEFKYDAVK